MIQDKIIFQFGDARDRYFTFNQGDKDDVQNSGVKEVKSSAPTFPGESRVNGLQANEKSILNITVNFVHADKPDTPYINTDTLLANLDREVRKLYAYTIDLENNIRFYVTYAEISQAPTMSKMDQETRGRDHRLYTVVFKSVWPFWWEVTDEIQYFNTTGFEQNKWYLDTGKNLDDGLFIDAGEANGFINLNTTSESTKIEWFDTCGIREHSVSWKDRHIIPEIIEVDTTNSYTKTLTSNTAVIEIATGLKQKSTEENRTYLVQFNPLNTDEWIHIFNLDTNSDLMITWKAVSANPNNLVYNSKLKRIYDIVTGTEIDPINYFADFTLNTFLYFNKTVGQSMFTEKSDTLKLQKNTSGNNTIYIDILKQNN